MTGVEVRLSRQFFEKALFIRCQLRRYDDPYFRVEIATTFAPAIQALAAQPEPVTLKELAATTGLHASTAHRILNDLVVGRYVERVDNGVYQLGMRLLELGSLVKGRLNVREAALSPMRARPAPGEICERVVATKRLPCRLLQNGDYKRKTAGSNA